MKNKTKSLKNKDPKLLKTILVFGAHPDDIEVGMGGTVSKLSLKGFKVQPIIATLPHFTKSDKKIERKNEAIESSKVLKCEKPIFLDISPAKMIFNRELVSQLDQLITKYEPIAVFTTWIGDSHQDHRILTRSVLAASRRINNIFMYETMLPGGNTENSFRPQLYVNIDSTVNLKQKAIDCLKSQKVRGGKNWWPSILGRCNFRGFQIQCSYAETFEVIKIKLDSWINEI